jgi:hypothetical protein
MILLDQPYVSEFLKNTIKNNNYPVLQNEYVKNMSGDAGIVLWREEQAIEEMAKNSNAPLYAPSENSIQWIAENLSFTALPNMINDFKDKARFRRLIAPLYPDFYFKEISFDALDDLNVAEIAKPFILKPAVGFFSMGVYKVSANEEWQDTVKKIKIEIESIQNLYPAVVLDTTRFIIEKVITGTEFAFDAYFNKNGEPVILNIYKHVFASDNDVSDRVYVTSKEIIQTYLQPFTQFLQDVSELAPMKNFPIHVEVRVGEDGVIRPIEINPLRFGGWCTTADMTFHAYNFNPYEYFFQQKSPNWNVILQDKDALYSIIVLDNSTGIDGVLIRSFDYDKLVTRFEKPLEVRKINFHEYPVFGFLFVETRIDNFAELESVLQSNLCEFIVSAR